MSGRPGAIRESRVSDGHIERPRNLEVEQAWKEYAQAYEEWQRIINSSTFSSMSGFANAEDERITALKDRARERDAALFEYYEAFDRDQNERE